ncbi:hypothetical protein SETIT_9G236500v2 [Setaria italica]|uniref:ARID domain-containing protein n=3 Tax=Setaria italica TaxID=4555 RepID=A0A368SK10_SETIT|nr:AT-rich interactive domain-containing protein 1 [Setaria italica]RCV42693.1 hypothetical protein SETIT_9G236500v2 [Setaria italica]
MAGPLAQPPSNSSALEFKSNASGPTPGHAPAVGAPASTEAAAPPVRVPSPAVLAVLGVVGELRARGFLARLENPEAELTDAHAPALFIGVLAAFLAEAGPAGATPSLLIPLPALADGREVELLRLFLAVRAHGGFAAVASWAAVAEAVGLDPASGAAVKLLYDKYLALLEHSIGTRRDDHEVVESSGNGDGRLRSRKDRFLSPTKGPTSAGSAHLKRKREPLVEMLNWVRLAAKSPHKPGVMGRKRNSSSHISTALLLRRQMFSNIDCRSGSPQNDLSNVEGAQENGWDVIPTLQKIDRIPAAPIRPRGRADIPEWTGKPLSPYDDPHTWKFLGEPILLPKSSEDPDVGSIGKGRQDDCNCQFPGSIACVRFHVAEKKIELKCELGSAFYEMGFHHMGEDLALTWTKDEQRKFNTTIQKNLPSSRSKYNFWDKLRAVFRSKGRKGLVSYYHNVFQVRRRAYQNRLTPKCPDSDEASIEPGFLHNQGGGQSSRSSSAASRTRRSS